MQVSTTKLEEKFQQFDLVIRVESKEEAQALYAIFNLWDNVNVIGEVSAIQIKAAIGDQYYAGRGDKVIANGVTYNEFYG